MGDNLKEIKAKMQVGITIVLGIFCLGELVFQPDNSTVQKWSFSIIGIIIGYWLK